MPAKRYIVNLSEEEKVLLQGLIRRGASKARTIARARVLLLADEHPTWSDSMIAEALQVSRPTVERTRKRCVMEGLEETLYDSKPRRDYERKLDGKGEAILVALACSKAPEGHTHWSLKLLSERLVELEVVDSISTECVRKTLKKTNSSPGIRKVG